MSFNHQLKTLLAQVKVGEGVQPTATTEDTQSVGNQSTKTENLENYQLARDRKRRSIRPPVRYEQVDFVGYALNCLEDGFISKPNSYKEVVNGDDSKL